MSGFCRKGGTVRRVVAEVAGTIQVPVETIAASGVEERNPHRHVVLYHVVVVRIAMVQVAVLHLPESVDGLAVHQTERLRHVVGVDSVRRAFGECRLCTFLDEYSAIWTVEAEKT